MKKNSFLFILLCATALLGGCQSSPKAVSAQSLKTLFGEDLSTVEAAFQWNPEQVQKKELPDTLLQQSSMYGCTLELNDMEILGGTASKVSLQFMGSSPMDAALTLIYAEYPETQDMQTVSDYLTGAWGDNRPQMYCSWPGRIYWSDLWAGTENYNRVDAYLQIGTSEKLLWGSPETVADALDKYEDPRTAYESWEKYSRIYAQSLKNDWEDVKEEPLITAVMLKNSEDYNTSNTVILDGFNLYMADMEKN